ncbi:MAG: 5'-nucleotidase C-terminal domain-containing protein [Bacteroidales bacterium]|nr:5'-nucleotidase C-terminal domain-containing protein [Bacteroidales bacterium]
MNRVPLIPIIILLLLSLSACNTDDSRPLHLNVVIVESTDVHGSFFPEDLVRQKKSKGSLAQGMSYLREQRAIKNQEVIMLDNGDILQGTPVVYYASYIDTVKPHLLAKIMNFMDYDAASVGNHDIEAGPKVYEQFRNEIDFPYLAANALDSSTNSSHFPAYAIINRQGVKIAVIGLITPSIPNWLPEKLWPGMYFDDMIMTAKKVVKITMESDHPDLIVGLFHAGVDATYGGGRVEDERNENASLLVAQLVPGFDIVFAGHDHKPLNQFVINTAGDSVLILNAGAHAHNFAVANVELSWNEKTESYDKKIKGHEQSLAAYAPDSLFMKKFSPYFEGVKAYMNQLVIDFDTTINANDALYGPAAFVDMIHQVQLEVSDADISFAAPFSTHAVLEKGPLYIRDMFKLYRYENFLCTLKMSGKEVREYLEFSTNLWFDSLTENSTSILLLKKDGKKGRYGLPLKNAYYNFDSGAGIKYIIDLSATRGRRVKVLSMADGSAFDENKIYTVVMNSYRANGGGNHLLDGVGLSKEELKVRRIHCTNEDFRRILTRWLQEKEHYKAQSMNNWSFAKIKMAQGKSLKQKDFEMLFKNIKRIN